MSIDLDALKRDLEAAGVPCQKMWREKPDPEGWSLFIGDPFGTSSYVQDNGWFALYGDNFDDSALAIIARHVQPAALAPDRAALVGRLTKVIHDEHHMVQAFGMYERFYTPIAEAALAAVEEAGGWPRPEPVERITVSLLADLRSIARIAKHVYESAEVDAWLADMEHRLAGAAPADRPGGGAG